MIDVAVQPAATPTPNYSCRLQLLGCSLEYLVTQRDIVLITTASVERDFEKSWEVSAACEENQCNSCLEIMIQKLVLQSQPGPNDNGS